MFGVDSYGISLNWCWGNQSVDRAVGDWEEEKSYVGWDLLILLIV